MASSRTVIIAGAGIGGLTAALALAGKGFRIVLLDQAERLEETGAGIQLSPNATRVLLSLGLGDRLKYLIVVPEAISIKRAGSGREIVRVPLGASMEFRYGTPYWVIHRGDLQAALLEAVRAHPDISLKLGIRVEDFAVHGHGVTAQVQHGLTTSDERGVALIGADGLWSILRSRLGDQAEPHFRGRTAWRATIPVLAVDEEFRRPVVNLWLGHHAHLVHYPIRGGSLVNVVAIIRDRWEGRDWNAAGAREDIMSRFSKRRWAAPARTILNIPDRWLKWALCDRPSPRRWSSGAVTLLGDAAHPMLPFLAQGAAMAIEDAAILADCMARRQDDLADALIIYQNLRRARTVRVQRAARANGKLYHLGGSLALARNSALRLMGGEKLRTHYDWIYDWRDV